MATKKSCMLCGKALPRRLVGWVFGNGLCLCRECVPKYPWGDPEMQEWAMESLNRPAPGAKPRKASDIPGQMLL